VSNDDVCNGVDDCGDGSDETNCTTHGCKSDQLKCADKQQCIDMSDVCNGVVKCNDMSDEKDCHIKRCPFGVKKCGNGTRLGVDILHTLINMF
jgi:hypothetical protein